MFRFQLRPRPNGQSLDGNGKDAAARGSGDLRRSGKAGAQVLRPVLQSYDYLEVLGFLAGRGLLRGGYAGGANDRVVADLGHGRWEDLFGNRIDADFSGL